MSRIASPHTLTVMDRTGHTELAYDPVDVEQLAGVQARFDQLLATPGYQAFVAEREGDIHQPTDTFKPSAFETIFITPCQGG